MSPFGLKTFLGRILKYFFRNFRVSSFEFLEAGMSINIIFCTYSTLLYSVQGDFLKISPI